MPKAAYSIHDEQVVNGSYLSSPVGKQETSQQLSQSFQLLEGKVERLVKELGEVSAQKDQELVSKNKIASRMRALLDFLPGGVIVMDARGYIVQTNPAAREMLQHELDGHRWRDLVSSCFAPKSDDGLEISTLDDRRISLATASLGEDGQIILLTDQTDNRRLQELASRQEKLSAIFFAKIAWSPESYGRTS